MKTVYDILISLKITHPYFTDEKFEDFELTANKKTNNLITEFRLLPKKTSNNWNLFFQSEGPFQTTPAALVDKEFMFTLKINNSALFTVSDNDYIPARGEMLYFDTSVDSEKFPRKIKRIYPLKLTYTLNNPLRPVNIIISTAKGTEIINETITDTTIKEKNFDLSTYGENVYNISEDNVPPANLLHEEMFARETAGNDPLYGTIYFKVLSIDDNANKNQYQISIKPNL